MSLCRSFLSTDRNVWLELYSSSSNFHVLNTAFSANNHDKHATFRGTSLSAFSCSIPMHFTPPQPLVTPYSTSPMTLQSCISSSHLQSIPFTLPQTPCHSQPCTTASRVPHLDKSIFVPVKVKLGSQRPSKSFLFPREAPVPGEGVKQ